MTTCKPMWNCKKPAQKLNIVRMRLATTFASYTCGALISMAVDEQARLLATTPVVVYAPPCAEPDTTNTYHRSMSRKRRRQASPGFAAALGTAAMLAAALAWAGRTPRSATLSTHPIDAAAAAATGDTSPSSRSELGATLSSLNMSISLSNQHERRNGAPIGQGYLTWPYLAEVLEPTRFEVDGWEDEGGDGYQYTIATVTGRDSSTWTTMEGPVAEFVYTHPGNFLGIKRLPPALPSAFNTCMDPFKG